MDVIQTDDPESEDSQTLDLTPRDVSPRRARSARRWPAFAVLIVIIAAIGFVLVSGLSDATTFFYNVDQAVAKKAEIGDRAVRLQGNVLPGSQATQADTVTFTLAYHGVSVDVVHHGDVPDLFQPAIPVIIEGRFQGDHFESDKILVRHDNTYDEKNSKRVEEACRDAQKTAQETARKSAEQNASSSPGAQSPVTPSDECAKVLGNAPAPAS